MNRLTGSHLQQLQDALLDAFPTHAALAQVVRFGLSESLDEVAGGGPLRDVVFALLQWTESRHRTTELLDAARAGNPTHPKLADVARELRGDTRLDQDDKWERDDLRVVFFEKVRRVYDLRRAKSDERLKVSVRRGVGAFPRVAVAEPDDDSRSGVRLVTGIPETPTLATLKEFVEGTFAPWQRVDERAVAMIVYEGGAPDDACLALARRARITLTPFTRFRGLIDFRDYLARQRAELADERDQHYAPRMYVPQRMTWRVGRQDLETEDALAEMLDRLREPTGTLALILGDFGTGNTFLMRQLASRLSETPSAVPMMVNLRLLNKSPRLDDLLSAHLVQRGNRHPDLEALHYMMEAGDVVLLFDGFDELALRVTYDHAAEHLATLLSAVKGKCRVVVTSRTQHFRNEDQSRTGLAERLAAVSHQEFALAKFDEARIRRFLQNHLTNPLDPDAKPLEGAALDAEVDLRYGLLRDIEGLGGLAETPRMLGMILAIPVRDLQAVKDRDGTVTAADLYDRLLTRWLTYEWERTNPPGETPGMPQAARWRFVTRFARRLWLQTDAGLPEKALLDEVTAVVRESKVRIEPAVAAQEVGSSTLLCRNATGQFSFMHESVLEYLVAREAADALKTAGAADMLDEGELSPLMARFFIEQVGAEAAAHWATTVPEARARARQNAVRVLALVDAEFATVVDFHGQDLREMALSRFQTKLARANLAGCTLSGMSLRGFVLRGANLRGAILRGADLTGADLTDADLTGADLTRAELAGARTEGARFEEAAPAQVSFAGAAAAPSVVESAVHHRGASVTPERIDAMTLALSPIACVTFDPVGELLALATGSSIRVVEVETRAVLRALVGHEGAVRTVAFSPDGKLLASGSDDHTVRLWDVGSGEQRAELRGHSNAVWSVAFSPDGKLLASGSDDHTARLWDVGSGAQHAEFRGHSNAVRSVAFNPNGKLLASGSIDQTVRLWGVDSST